MRRGSLPRLAVGLLAPARRRPRHAAGHAARGSFTLEHALTLRSYSDLAWSPDGRRLAFVVSGADTAENTTNADVWLAD